MQVFDSRGKPVHFAKVRGTGATWRPKSASSANTWSLRTADGRVTEAVPFDVEYKVGFEEAKTATMRRTVDVTLPVTCGTTTGKYDVDLRLTASQTFEKVEVTVANAEAFQVAELAPFDRASFTYRFVAAKPCVENTLEAKVRVVATLRIALP